MSHLPFDSKSFSFAGLLAGLDFIKLKDVSTERDLSYSLRDVIVSMWPDSKVYAEKNISDDDRFRYDIVIQSGGENSVIELAFLHGSNIANVIARKERLLAERATSHPEYSFYILGFVSGRLTGISDFPFEVHEYSSRDGKEYTFIYKLLSGKHSEKPAEKIKEIDSVESMLRDLKWKEMSGSVFFRGQWNLDYILLPRALRHPGVEDYEKNLFLEIMTNHPDEYMGQSNLQKLSRMQHDTIPTRLLDISSNPLVALFFAVSSIKQSEQNESSGWLICFPIDKDNKDRAVQPYNSERCICLSALVNLGSSEQRMLWYYAVMDYLIQIYSSGLAYDLTEMESSSLFYMIVRDTVRYILTQMVLRGRQDTSSRYYVTKQYEKRLRE